MIRRSSPEVTKSPSSRHSGTNRETDAHSCPSCRSASRTGWSHKLLVNNTKKLSDQALRECDGHRSKERELNVPRVGLRRSTVSSTSRATCDQRQLKALAVPPIRNQIPLQTGTSTRLRERDSFVRPIACPMPSLARSRASHRGRCRTWSRTLLSGPVGAPASHRPASRHGGAPKNPNQF